MELTIKNKIGYMAGDFGNMMSFGMSASFLLVYYVDVLGITAAAAGTLFLIARIWDGINDPMMGVLIDKMFAKHQGKGDKFRPYILKGAWLLFVASVLMFWSPESLSTGQKLIWAYVTYIFWGMSYTFVNIPYGAVASVMTQEPSERAALAANRMVGSLFGGSCAKFIVPVVLGIFVEDAQTGYFVAMLTMASLGLISHLLCYSFIDEKVKIVEKPNKTKGGNVSNALKAIAKNRPLICVSIATFLMLLGLFSVGSVLLFFIKIKLENAIWVLTVIGVVELLAGGLIVYLLPLLMKKLGTKRLMTSLCLMASATYAFAFIFVDNAYTFIGIYFFTFILASLPLAAVWAQISDAIEYNQYLTGSRQDGLIYSSYSLIRKFGGAGAAFFAGVAISYIGYNPSLDVQSSQTVSGIQFLMFAYPSICFFISALVYGFMWNLTPSLYKKVLAHNQAMIHLGANVD
ncbi:glycoside-pentoside-hexuronide (GPH):cation symporter [Vibrio harveyi]|uniref:glycoside-pentoside-hexuronide (GPH):cation symporter n=1 Tax=Vibrio harveyi TaxID=669 RepID=UPI003CF1A4D0